jgi:hypothetical protein
VSGDLILNIPTQGSPTVAVSTASQLTVTTPFNSRVSVEVILTNGLEDDISTNTINAKSIGTKNFLLARKIFFWGIEFIKKRFIIFEGYLRYRRENRGAKIWGGRKRNMNI